MKEMKNKLVPVFLVIAMLFTLCSCGNTVEDKESAFPDTLTDEDLVIAEGIPSVSFEGNWKKVEDPDGENYKSLALYVNEDETANDVAVGFYTWEKSEASLVEEAKSALTQDYPKQASMQVYEGTTWFEPGDYNYVYYCAFDDTSFEDYTYCQAYFFEVDGTIYEYDYFTATEAINMGDIGLQYFGPKCTEQLELDEDYIEDGLLAARHCPDGEFCDYDLYVFDKEDDTLETMTQWFYDNKDEVISVQPYKFTSRLGNDYEGIYVIYEDTYKGVKYYNATALELIGDKFIAVNCYTPLESENEYADIKYTMECAESMSYAFIGY